MPERLPLFPLGVVLFPGAPLPLHIVEPRYREMLRHCLAGNRIFGVVLIKRGVEVGAPAEPHRVGASAVIAHVENLPDGRANIITVGRRRFEVVALDTTAVFPQGWVNWLDEPIGGPSPEELGVEATRLLEIIDVYAKALPANIDLSTLARIRDNPVSLAYAVASSLPGDLAERQALLEMPTAYDRLKELNRILRRDLALLQQGIPMRNLRPRPQSLN